MFGTTLGPLLMRDGERSARLLTSRTASNGYKPAAASGNALPHFCGGQVVAGSNPVSPTHVSPTQHYPRSKAIMVNRGRPRWVSIGVCTATGTAS